MRGRSDDWDDLKDFPSHLPPPDDDENPPPDDDEKSPFLHEHEVREVVKLGGK